MLQLTLATLIAITFPIISNFIFPKPLLSVRIVMTLFSMLLLGLGAYLLSRALLMSPKQTFDITSTTFLTYTVYALTAPFVLACAQESLYESHGLPTKRAAFITTYLFLLFAPFLSNLASAFLMRVPAYGVPKESRGTMPMDQSQLQNPNIPRNLPTTRPAPPLPIGR